MTKRKLFNKSAAFLLIVPIFIVLLANIIRTSQGPYYQAFILDPSYAYVLNSLNIVNGEMPGHTDHPGTTVQLLGGLVLKIHSLVGEFKGEKTNITIKVLQNPERYIAEISKVLVCIIGITIFIFGLQVYLATNHLGLAIILQAFPLTSSTLIEHLPRLEPEPLLIASAYLLSATLVPIATGTEEKASSSFRAFIAGTIMAVGVVTKVTFAPLILFLIVFRGNKAKSFAVIAIAGTIIMTTTPIWESIPRVANWLLGVITHSGHYGSGEIGLPAASRLLSNGVSLFEATPVIFIFIPFLFLSLFKIKTDGDGSIQNRFVIVSLLVITCSLAITIKHYSPHYLMHIIGASGLFVLGIVMGLPRHNINLITSLILIVSILMTFRAFNQTRDTLMSYKNVQSELSSLQDVARQYGCRVVNYYRSSSPEYALQFGNNFARNIYYDDLNKLYPEFVSYNIWKRGFAGFQGALSPSAVDELLQSSSPICLLGTERLPHKEQPLVEIIEQKGQLSLYQFLGFTGY